MAANSSDAETMKSIIIGHDIFYQLYHYIMLSLKEAIIGISIQNYILDCGALKVKEVTEH